MIFRARLRAPATSAGRPRAAFFRILINQVTAVGKS